MNCLFVFFIGYRHFAFFAKLYKNSKDSRKEA